MHNAWVCPHAALGPSGNVLVETHLPAVISALSSSLLLCLATQKSWKCLLQGPKVFNWDCRLKSRTSECSVVVTGEHWWSVSSHCRGLAVWTSLEGHLLLIRVMMCRQSSLTPAGSSVSVSVDGSWSRLGSKCIDGFCHSKERMDKLFWKKMENFFLFLRALIKWNCKTWKIFLSQEKILFVC